MGEIDPGIDRVEPSALTTHGGAEIGPAPRGAASPRGSLHSTRHAATTQDDGLESAPMKAWGGLPGDDPKRDRAEKEAAVEAAGIDLDPPPPGSHRHGDETHPSDHAHPHVHSEPGQPPVIGIVGAGAVGTALGLALSRAGWPIHAVASRDPGRRERFRSMVDVVRVFADPEPILDEVELIILAVPDDALARLAGTLRMYGGQAMVHTSGALGPEVLAPAMAAGTQIGAFHPLVAFADTERAVAALHGATIAIEGDDQLVAMLADMAEAIGARPVRLAPGSKSAYHAAAVLAAGGFVALLDAIAELGRVAGLDESGSLAIYGPLIEGTLGNARALGIRASLTGPMTRGDIGTLRSHLDALRVHAPGVLDLYVAAARREIDLAEARGALAPDDAMKMRLVLTTALQALPEPVP
jgi:predicted short-subunit dehydrogenase-like oxidoreductase (DUF2520 family)